MSGGLVGIIANDAARFSVFGSCVSHLRAPDGSRIEWLIGGDWCGARNTLVEMVLAGDDEWLWFMDDDHAFPPDMLLKLLGHDKPIVSPVCLTRVAPFMPVQYVSKDPEADKVYLPIPLDDRTPQSGLVELEAGGCAGMLIRRAVLEAVDPPWFEYTNRSEDIIFCEKAKAAGFEIHCDVTQRLGHITTAVVFPKVEDDQWMIGLQVGSYMSLVVPFESTESEEE